jgi:hypothetical protein
MANSYKQRDRQRAYNAGQLHEWHNAQRDGVPKREAEAPAKGLRPNAPPTPPASPFDNYEAISTPVGMVWREDERWPTWSLPTQVASPRGRY